MFQIFVSQNCRIFQLYWCFHQSICSKPVKETCETVHSILKETCQKVTRFDEPYKTVCFWGINETWKYGLVYDLGVVQICGVLPCLSWFTFDAARGLQCPKETCKNMDGETIDWRRILWNHDDACDQLFRIFPSGKTGTRRREHRVYWFPSSVYWFLICDGRNCELLNSIMTQICSRNRPHRVVKYKMSLYELKPPKQKGVNLEGLGGWVLWSQISARVIEIHRLQSFSVDCQ